MPTSRNDRKLPERVEVAIVGGGQAGLSLSRLLCDSGTEHVVLERHKPGHAWRNERWDSFCLVTPNWQCRLPHYPYAGDDPNGFMVKDEIAAYLDGFVRSFDPPLREGVEVRGLARSASEAPGYRLETSQGPLAASQVVVATGGYHDPIVPDYASALGSSILQLHSTEYRNPRSLPPGAVLVVGSGQSGAQIAEDLHLAGRQVHLCVGGAPRVSRFYRGKDVVEWLDLMSYYDISVDEHPLREGVRDRTNHYVTGRDGGRDIDLRRFANEGMRLYGTLANIEAGMVRCKPDLRANLDAADEVNEGIKRAIDGHIERQGIDAPRDPPYAPCWRPPPGAPCEFDLGQAGIGSVIWCIGFRSNFRWIDLPVLGEGGGPMHKRGVSNQAGFYFLGLPWLHTWGSGRFSGISRDAAYLAERIRQLAARQNLATAS